MATLAQGRQFPAKEALGEFLARFHAEYQPDTAAATEWRARAPEKAMMFVPGRMVDRAEEMISSYRRNDNTSKTAGAAPIPIVLVAMDATYTPVTGDYGRQQTEAEYFSFPGDVKQRAFKVKVMIGEVRAQMAIIAADTVTANSIARQLGLWLASLSNRNFYARHTFAGLTDNWPVQVQTPDVQMIATPQDQSNLYVMAVDVTLRESTPIFYAPGIGEQNDGLGTGINHPTDPHGYPVVVRVNATNVALPQTRVITL